MNEEKQIGTLLGLDLILSPEHYKKINDLIEENKKLKEELENKLTPDELVDMLNKELLRQNNNYKNILTELEEWLKGRIEWNKSILEEDGGKPDLLGFNFHRQAYIKVWEEVLDKIQELKEKYK